MTTAIATKQILHVGCGRNRYTAQDLYAAVGLTGLPTDGTEVVHLDADARLRPDIACVLGEAPIPLPDDSVTMVVAWHVLEHIGRQGDVAAWQCAWEELYRVLKPGGWVYGECPYYTSIWAWSDPTHTRAISEHSFTFLMQDAYRITGSPISPYRWRCDFQWLSLPGLPQGWAIVADRAEPKSSSLRFALTAKKPLQPWWVS